MSQRDRLTNQLLLLRNTVLISLPSCNLPDEANGLSLGRSAQLTKLSAKRKGRILQSAGRLLTQEEVRRFTSALESCDWLIELAYKGSFGFVDFMDFRNEGVRKALYTLLTLVVLDWGSVWVVHTLRLPRSEHVAMAYRLSSPYALGDEHLALESEREELSVARLQQYKLYRRRLGTVLRREANPLGVALSFYWHHFTLRSEFMRAMALCISLESLFNTGPHEIRKSVALCVSHLLGKSEEEKEGIFRDVTRLYDFRSSIVHGDIVRLLKNVEERQRGGIKDLQLLHECTRRCLRTIIEKRRLTPSFLRNKDRIEAINRMLLRGGP